LPDCASVAWNSQLSVIDVCLQQLLCEDASVQPLEYPKRGCHSHDDHAKLDSFDYRCAACTAFAQHSHPLLAPSVLYPNPSRFSYPHTAQIATVSGIGRVTPHTPYPWEFCCAGSCHQLGVFAGSIDAAREGAFSLPLRTLGNQQIHTPAGSCLSTVCADRCIRPPHLPLAGS
jgi:hypothetical protein